MGDVAVTIDGIAETSLRPGWSINATINGVDSFDGEVLSKDASNRPDIDDEFVITEPDYPGTGTERIMGGLIVTPTERGLGGSGAKAGIITRLSVTDFNALAERRCLYGTRPAETLKARLIWITTYLAEYGVTLHADQVDGPTLAAHDYDNEQASQALEALTSETGGEYLHEIDYNKVLRMAPVGGEASPFDILDGDGTEKVIGDIEVTKTRNNYANRVTGRYNGDASKLDTFTVDHPWVGKAITAMSVANPTHVTCVGHGLTNGQQVYITGSNATPSANGFWNVTVLDADHFTVPENVTIAGNAGTVWTDWGPTTFNLSSIWLSDPGYLTINGTPNIPLATDSWRAEEDAASPSGWVLRTGTPQADDTVIDYAYTSKFASVVVANDLAEQAANKLWEIPPIDLLNVFDEASAQALVENYLAQRKQVRMSVRYTTRERGLKPGQTQTITVAKRNIDGDFLITSVDMQHVGGDLIDRTITAIEGAVLLTGSWREAVAQMLGGGSTGATPVTAVLSAGGTVGGSRVVYSLAGDGNAPVQSAGPDWAAANAIRARIDSARFGRTGSVTVRLKGFDASVTVKARLYDVTNDVSCGVSVTVTEADWSASDDGWATVSFAVDISDGVADYQLQLLPNTANADVVASGGFLES